MLLPQETTTGGEEEEGEGPGGGTPVAPTPSAALGEGEEGGGVPASGGSVNGHPFDGATGDMTSMNTANKRARVRGALVYRDLRVFLL